MKLLLTHIRSLLQTREGHSPIKGSAMKDLPAIDDAWILIDSGRISDFGSMDTLSAAIRSSADKAESVSGRYVMPAYCDSHSHLVFAATREQEFVDRIHGLSYQEIAAKGGGILNSAAKLREMSEDELYEQSMARLQGLMRQGTGALEIKSGYGLTPEAELKMLRVAKRLKENSPVLIKTTFLGAHALPTEYKSDRTAYLDLMIDEVLPQVAAEGLADYVDVFCETNYFTVDEMARMIRAGQKVGLGAKVHVNQFTSIGGIQKCVELGALSVDHLEEMTADDLDSLSGSETIATALPSCSFFLSIPYAPVREMMDRNIAVALASDLNPGSTPSGNMNFVMSLACIKMRMDPSEALNAMTVNGAAAMQVGSEVGSIAIGKRAHLIVTKPMESLARIPYSFGESMIEEVILGEWRSSR